MGRKRGGGLEMGGVAIILVHNDVYIIIICVCLSVCLSVSFFVVHLRIVGKREGRFLVSIGDNRDPQLALPYVPSGIYILTIVSDFEICHQSVNPSLERRIRATILDH